MTTENPSTPNPSPTSTLNPPITLDPNDPFSTRTVSLSHASLFIPIFEGKEAPGSVALEDFLQALRMVKALGFYQDSQVLHLAALRLKGPAREYTRIRPELLKGTLDEFVNAFRKRFGERKDSASALAELLSIEQKPAEKVYEFAQRVKLLLDAFFLSNKISADSEVAKVMTNEIAKMTFAKGLQPDIRKAVLSKKTPTLEDTVEAARDEELNLSIGTPSETPVALIRETERENEIAALKEEIIRLRQQLISALTASSSDSARNKLSKEQDQRHAHSEHNHASQDRPSQQVSTCQGCGASDHQREFCPHAPVQICYYCRHGGYGQPECRPSSRGRSPRRTYTPRRSNSPPRLSRTPERFRSTWNKEPTYGRSNSFPRYSPAPKRSSPNWTRESRYRGSPAPQWGNARESYWRPTTQWFPKNGNRAPRR